MFCLCLFVPLQLENKQRKHSLEMKKIWLAILLAVLMIACSESQKSADHDGSLSTDSVSVGDSLLSLSADSVETEAMPAGADELFDDFFFNYASSKMQQKKRTAFPLPVVKEKNCKLIAKKDWKMEPFFMKDDAYTLFFDSQEQMKLVTDTSLMVVTVERFWLDQDMVEQFIFSREKGCWMLHEIRYQPLPQNANAQFLQFYERFVTDSIFQYQSLAQQIQFSGPDPEDDFSTIDGVITPDFWEAFRPELPHQKLYNIVYGHQNPAAIQKILLLRGISNGLEVEITFQLKKGRWKLTKLNT